MQVNEILEACLYVDDLDAAEAFYTRVLGLKLHGKRPGRHVFFHCGGRMLLLFDPRESGHSEGEIPPHGAQGQGHVCFAVPDVEIDAWQTHLEQQGVPIETIFDWPGGGRSLYFRDPTGNSLEIASPRIWHIEESDCLPRE